MIRNLIAIVILLSLAPASYGAPSIETERTSLCRVELYEERYESEVCGWVYEEERTNACEVECYDSGPHMFCPGSANGGRKMAAQIGSSNGSTWSIDWRTATRSTVQGTSDVAAILGSSISSSAESTRQRLTGHIVFLARTSEVSPGAGASLAQRNPMLLPPNCLSLKLSLKFENVLFYEKLSCL